MFNVHTNSQRRRRQHVQKVLPQRERQVDGICVLPIVRVRLLPALVNPKVEATIVESIDFKSKGCSLVLADLKLFESFDFERRARLSQLRFGGIHNREIKI